MNWHPIQTILGDFLSRSPSLEDTETHWEPFHRTELYEMRPSVHLLPLRCSYPANFSPFLPKVSIRRVLEPVPITCPLSWLKAQRGHKISGHHQIRGPKCGGNWQKCFCHNCLDYFLVNYVPDEPVMWLLGVVCNHHQLQRSHVHTR